MSADSERFVIQAYNKARRQRNKEGQGKKAHTQFINKILNREDK